MRLQQSLSILVLLGVAMWGVSCKTTETTRHTGTSDPGDTSAVSGRGGGDVQSGPVTVLPGGETSGPGDDEPTGSNGGSPSDAISSDSLPTSDDGGDPGGATSSDAGESGTSSSSSDPTIADEDLWIPEDGDFVLRDRETGTWWNLRGQAFRGPLEGKKLTQVPGFNSFWFAWSVFYHGSKVWQKNGSTIRNTPGEIESDDGCAVPCDDIQLGCRGGKDCIPALDYKARTYAGKPRPEKAEMVEPGAKGTGYLDDRDFVFGVVVDGEARAYPHNIYWRHEIHNDRIGGREYTVTFCPLTGSGIVFDGLHKGRPIRFGVSGRLYNANLVMFDPRTDTFWSQMLGSGIKGQRMGQKLTRLPVVETTWERWKEMYPETLVTSSNTGYGGGYQSYPYGDYRSNHNRTFGADQHQKTYKAKERVLGLPGSSKEKSLAFPFPEMDSLPGDRNVIHASFEGTPIVVVYEAEHRMAIPYRRTVDGRSLTFIGKVKGGT